MVGTTTARPALLIAAAPERALGGALRGLPYAVTDVHTGALALERAHDVRPDVIIVQSDLPDMSAIHACRLLHDDPLIGHRVPILILSVDQPTPEQRVAALRAGAWDFLRYPRDVEEFLLTLQTYVQAKRNIDVALSDGPGDATTTLLVDPTTGLHNRAVLARRARELGALMARQHGALACVVFVLETEAVDSKVSRVIPHVTRVSDVVGALGPAEIAVLAPATDHAGAVTLTRRVLDALRKTPGGDRVVPGSTLRVGYDAVANLKYSPIDPVELLASASAAVRHGKPEPDYSWVRRHDAGRRSGGERAPSSRPSPVGTVFDARSSNA
ncbi:MAG TPA: response regulator [Gemmatimonadales bacterium]